MKKMQIALFALLIYIACFTVGCGNAVADAAGWPKDLFTYDNAEDGDTADQLIKKRRQKKEEEQEIPVEELNIDTEALEKERVEKMLAQLEPSNFLEYEYEIAYFESFADIIDKLHPCNGFAYADIYGRDEASLIISESTYETEEGEVCATEGYIYIMRENKAICIGAVTSYDNTYPIRIEDGVLYEAGDDQVGAYYISDDGYGLMLKENYSMIMHDDGNVGYMGFSRETNSLEEATEIIESDDDEAFLELFGKYQAASLLKFTPKDGVVGTAESALRRAEEEGLDEMYEESPEGDPDAEDGEYYEDEYYEGEYPEGEYPEGEYPEGEYPEREYQEGEYPEGEYPEGEHPAGQYPEDEFQEGGYTDGPVMDPAYLP